MFNCPQKGDGLVEGGRPHFGHGESEITMHSPLFLAGVAVIASSATADIIGLVPGTYEYNTADAGSPPVVGPDFIQLTTGDDQRRSIFFYDRQNITEFSVSFTYRATAVGNFGNFPALAFVIQDHVDGVDSLGGGRTAYEGITNSAAVTMEYNSNVVTSFSGVFTNGNVGDGSDNTAPVNLYGGNDIAVDILYNGSTLNLTFEDTQTGDIYDSGAILVGSLESVIGGPTAFVGFTATSDDGANHHLSDFRFTVIPTPGAVALLSMSGLLAVRRRR